jgi:hypothetical protein
MVDLKLTSDDKQILDSLDKIAAKLEQTGKTAESTQDAISAGMGKSASDAERAAASLEAYKQAQERLAAGAQDRIAKQEKFRKEIEAHRKAQEALAAAQNEGIKKNVAMASTLNQATASTNQAASATKSAEAATKGMTVAQRIFDTVLKASPIGFIVALVAKLVQQLFKYQEVIDAAARASAVFDAAINVVIKRLSFLAEGIYKFITLDYSGAAIAFGQAFNNIGGAIYDAAAAADANELALQKLRDAQFAAAISTAKLVSASEKAQEAAGKENLTYNQRIASLKKAIEIEGEISRIRVGFAEQELQYARTAFQLSTQNAAEKEKLIKKEIEVMEVRSNAEKNRLGLLQRLNALEKERADFITKNLDDVSKLLSRLDIDLQEDPTEKKVEQIRQGITAQVQAIQDGLKKIAEVEKLRPLSDKEIEQRQKLQDRIVDTIEQGEKEILDAILDGIQKEAEAEEKRKEAKKAADEGRIKDAQAALAQANELENARIDITQAEFANFVAMLRAGGADEQAVKEQQNEFNKRIQAQRLEADLRYQKALLALNASGPEADIIRARIQEIETLLKGIDIPEPKKGPDGQPINLFDILGIKLPPGQEEAIRKSIGSIINSLNELAQARINEAEAATRAAQEKVEAAEEALEKEQEYAKQGLANNVDLKKQELATAKKLRDDAAKEEAKARRAQIYLDSAVQLSGLITSSVNIFKSLSSLGPLGIGLAIGTIGLMFGAFATAKARALKATEPPKLRKGRKFDGNTHEQGNEDLVFDGRRIFAVEKDEWLVGTEHSKEHDKFLANLNRGKYRGRDLYRMAEGISDHESPLSDAAPRIKSLERRRERAESAQKQADLAKAYQAASDRIVEAIQAKPTVYPWKDGYKEVVTNGRMKVKKTVLPKGK